MQIVPCGQCIGCRNNRSESWATRMVHEAQLHKHNAFLTLTYNQKHLPLDGSLNPIEVTLFLKRLRERIYPKKISYFYCGEYGENYSRPHYHMALFGYDFSEDRVQHRKCESGYVYRSPLLEELWPFGYSEIGNLEYDSARYIAGYIQKKITGKNASSQYEITLPSGEISQILPEFARMSKNPAIGLNWIKKYADDIYNYDCATVGGKKLKTPAYYDKFLQKHDPARYEQTKINREGSCIKTRDENEMIRQYEAKLVASENVTRSFEGDSARSPETLRVAYYKRVREANHKLTKESL